MQFYQQSKFDQYSQHFPPLLTNSSRSPLQFASKKLQHISCIMEADQNFGGLYIGDIISTVKPGILQSGNIKAILACSFQETHFRYQARTDYIAQQKIIDIHDSMEYPIKMHFQSAFNFIDNHRNMMSNVLVHCHAGVSRSATIVIAYLMWKNKWTASRALHFVKSKRQRVKPNQNFWQQLIDYQNEILSYPNQQILSANDRPISNLYKNVNQPSKLTSYLSQERFIYIQQPNQIRYQSPNPHKNKLHQPQNINKIYQGNSVYHHNSFIYKQPYIPIYNYPSQVPRLNDQPQYSISYISNVFTPTKRQQKQSLMWSHSDRKWNESNPQFQRFSKKY